MKHLLFFLIVFPFLASAQILEKQFVATVQYSGFTQINDSLYRGDLIEFRDVLIEGYQPSGVDSGFICLDATGRAYRVEVINSFDFSSLNVDLIELDDYDEIPIGVGIVAERYGSTYQIPNGLVNSIGISSVLQAKILNHNTKIAATTVQPPDTLYLQELSGTTAISNGDTIPLIDYVRVVDTPAMLLNYPSTAGYGIIDGGKTWTADTTSPNGLATRKYALTLPTTLTANYAAISNGTNLVARNLFDNGSKVSILNGAPLELPKWTTAGRPIGVNNSWGFNTTNNWLEGYSVSGWVAPAQAANADGKFLVGTIPYADANGRLKYGAYNEIYMNAADFVVYRAPLFSSNLAGVPGSLKVQNTNTTSGFGYASVLLYPSTGGHFAQFFCTNTLYPGYGVISPNSFGHYTNGSGGMAVQLENPAASIRFGVGFSGIYEKMRIDVNGVGVLTTPTQELDVNGDVRVRDSLQLPILSSILQTETSGWVKALTIGSGLNYSSGTLSSTATWLKTELEENRDVDITGATSTDLRIRNTRVQFDDKFKVGADSSLSYNPATAVLKILKPSIQANFELHGNMELNTAPATGSVYIGAYGVTGFAAEADSTTYLYSTNKRFAILHGYGFSVNDDVLMQATKSAKITFRGFNDTIPGIGISLSKATFIREKLIIAPDSTFKFNPSNDVLQLSQMGQGNKEAADLSKTQSNYIAGFATDGTVLDLERKRDTTIYVIDTDYDFSAALTTTQVGNRYNRVILLMTTTAAAGSDSELTLHTPDANLMQVEYLVRSTDEAGGFANKIVFGTNNAVDSTNGLVTNYFPAAGQGVGIRAGLRSAVYKYFYY